MSIGSIVLIILATFVVLTAVPKTTRRIWVFHLYAWKYAMLWLFDKVTFRRKYTFPMLLRLFCEDMGPTFIKFGQIIASSTGVFPKRYSEEFQKCLDRVRPFEFAEVQKILVEELGSEATQLTNIDPTPLASASIAQVHTATLKDGENVVFKVQRPGIADRVEADMRLMRMVAKIAEKVIRDAELVNPVGIVEDFHETLREELDFRKEAVNLDQFNDIMVKLGHKDVRAPRPNNELTTQRVLVMERFHGIRVDNVAEIHARKDLDIEERLVKGMRAWFQCVLFYGFFHGDVHAGNLMLLDNHDVGFLDFGIVGRFNSRQRAMVTDYLIAFVSADYKSLARVITEMGGVKTGVDQSAFVADLEKTYSPLLKMSFQDIKYGEILPAIQKVASRHRMKMPKEFVLITKQMLYFDRYARLLAPTLNVFSDPRLVASLMQDIMKAKLSAVSGQQSASGSGS